MTKTDRYVALALVAIIHAAALSDSQEPKVVPGGVKKIPAGGEKEAGPSGGVFIYAGEGESAGWMTRRLKLDGYVTTAGIRPTTAKFFPTDAEFDAWLALPDDHEFAGDLDGYLESIR